MYIATAVVLYEIQNQFAREAVRVVLSPTYWDLKPIKPTFEFNCIFLQQMTLKVEASSLLTQYAGKTLKLLSSMPKWVNVKAGSEHSYKWSWQLKGQKTIDSGYTQLEETKILWRRVQCIQ